MSAQATDNRTEWNEKGEKGEEEKEGEEEENNPVKSPFSCYSPVNKKKGKSLKKVRPKLWQRQRKLGCQ